MANPFQLLVTQLQNIVTAINSVTTTINAISAKLNPTSSKITMRQLLAALAQKGYILGVYAKLPGVISNQYNIAWYHAYYITIDDPFVTGFLQPTLGYTTGQMTTLFTLAATFPA